MSSFTALMMYAEDRHYDCQLEVCAFQPLTVTGQTLYVRLLLKHTILDVQQFTYDGELERFRLLLKHTILDVPHYTYDGKLERVRFSVVRKAEGRLPIVRLEHVEPGLRAQVPQLLVQLLLPHLQKLLYRPVNHYSKVQITPSSDELR